MMIKLILRSGLLSIMPSNGRWTDDLGKTFKGGKTYIPEVPIDLIPIFTIVK